MMWKNTGMIPVLFLSATESQYNAGERRQHKWADDALGGRSRQIHFPFFWGCWAAVSLYLWSGPAAFPLPSPETPDSRWGNHGVWICPIMGKGDRGHPICPASETQWTHWGNSTTGRWLHCGSSMLLFKERCPRDVPWSCPEHNVLPTTAKWKTCSEKKTQSNKLN